MKRAWIYTYDRNQLVKSMRWTRRRQHKTLVMNQKMKKKEVKEFREWAIKNHNRIRTHSRWRTVMKASLMEHPEASTIF